MIFIDTCIVIDYINGKLEILEHQKKFSYMNSVVENEIIVGAKNKRDLATTNKKISDFPMLDIDQDIMDLSTKLLNQYGLSGCLRLHYRFNLSNLRFASVDT